MYGKNKKLESTEHNALVWKGGGLFVAKTVEVEVVSQDKTKALALKNLEEALHLYFEDEDTSSKEIKPFSILELHQIPCKYNYA